MANPLKQICIVHRKSGFNSKRLVLNAILDMVEDMHSNWFIEVSPEMSMHDLATTIESGLGYNASVKRSNRPNGIVVESITLEIES